MEKKTYIDSVFIKKANERFNFKYNYSNLDYIDDKHTINVKCPIHGEFQVNPLLHLKGAGCLKCKYHYLQKEKTEDKIYLIMRGHRVHNNKYTYERVINFSLPDAFIEINCPKHGYFWQNKWNHFNGSGCPVCRNEKFGWEYSKWKKAGKLSKNFNGFKLYIIEFFNENEKFIKIGKTYNEVEKRIESIPYNYNLIKIEYGDALYISKKENELHNKFKTFKYIPNKKFGGMHECFNINVLDFIDYE